MKLTIKIESYNSDVGEQAASRMLQEIISKINDGVERGPVKDINGNKVGEFIFELDEDENSRDTDY